MFQSLRKGKYPSKWDGNIRYSFKKVTVSIPEKREIPFEGMSGKVSNAIDAMFQSLRKGKYPSKIYTQSLKNGLDARFNP